MGRVVVLVAWLGVASGALAEEALVFAAASTADALQELAPEFQKATGHTVTFSFGGSSDLSRQLRAGAPADVFLSADTAQMDAAVSAGKIQRGDVKPLLSNQLVVVTSKRPDAPELGRPEDLKKVKRLALADPEAVPAGVYAKEFLTKLGLWNALESKVIPLPDVRAALAAVEAGRADAAIVYRTDATRAKEARIELFVPKSRAPEITYPIAKVAEAPHPKAADAFVAFVRGPAGARVFKKHGFILKK